MGNQLAGTPTLTFASPLSPTPLKSFDHARPHPPYRLSLAPFLISPTLPRTILMLATNGDASPV